MSLSLRWARGWSLRSVLVLAGLVRACLLVWGEWQDRHLSPPYTDIDYGVFTDGARLVAHGASPFDRATYRYSPALAWLLLPAVWLPWFGKLLFSACDCLLGALLASLLSLRGVPSGVVVSCVAALLFNPLSLAVSTRGNGDVVHMLLLYGMLYCLMARRGAAAAVCFGAAVHLRLYPVVYLPALLGALDSHFCSGGRHCCCGLHGPQCLDRPLGLLASAAAALGARLPPALPPSLFAASPTRHRAMFAVLSGGTFAGLCAACFALYGWVYVGESVLHHVGRVDTRHNFSLLFYPLYLAQRGGVAAALSLASFAPQLCLAALCTARLSADLPLCLLVQTAAFVAFNKVVTAQYFLWYVSLLPLVLPFSRLSGRWLAALSAAWLCAELHWLSWAYRVELLGLPAFRGLHAASCAFFLVCTACTAALIAKHANQPLFDDGRVTQYGQQQQQQRGGPARNKQLAAAF